MRRRLGQPGCLSVSHAPRRAPSTETRQPTPHARTHAARAPPRTQAPPKRARAPAAGAARANAPLCAQTRRTNPIPTRLVVLFPQPATPSPPRPCAAPRSTRRTCAARAHHPQRRVRPLPRLLGRRLGLLRRQAPHVRRGHHQRPEPSARGRSAPSQPAARRAGEIGIILSIESAAANQLLARVLYCVRTCVRVAWRGRALPAPPRGVAQTRTPEPDDRSPARPRARARPASERAALRLAPG